MINESWHVTFGWAHWPMAVSRCMVECLLFYEYLLILYSQGSIAWSLKNVWQPYSLILSPDPQAMIPHLNVNKQRDITTPSIAFFRDGYSKQRHVDMLSLVSKKLNLCPIMLASRGVNPLATSHTVEHLLCIWLSSCSHDKPILNLISFYLNKIYIFWNPWWPSKNVFLILEEKKIYLRLCLGSVTLQDFS